MNLLFPLVALEKAETPPLPRFDITGSFSSREINHVRTSDPRLFTEGNILLIDLLQLQKEGYAFPLPGAKVISPYGGRRKGHSGIDLKTVANDTIRAAFDGVVRMAKPYAAYGNVMVIRHYNGLETVYSHNARHLVKQGDRITAGQPVALLGRTGRATTEHLHFETRIDGQHFNPSLLFDFERRTLQDKCLVCTKKGHTVVVEAVPPFPHPPTASL
ncbi:MAG: M23 family metallopeptidase [Tannerellaceae bacterium]|nr:M23 family metallopeptidase [Tannerellaceae bacterium]